jgi:uncharacterized peroxidase-related enzyme
VEAAIRGEVSEPPRLRSLCDFAAKLTRQPALCEADDAEALREAGFSDAAIHDAIQVVSYFNYINRVADAVGIEDEPEWADPQPS